MSKKLKPLHEHVRIQRILTACQSGQILCCTHVLKIGGGQGGALPSRAVSEAGSDQKCGRRDIRRSAEIPSGRFIQRQSSNMGSVMI